MIIKTIKILCYGTDIFFYSFGRCGSCTSNLCTHQNRKENFRLMELIYFFIGLGVVTLGILVYTLVSMYREKHSQKA